MISLGTLGDTEKNDQPISPSLNFELGPAAGFGKMINNSMDTGTWHEMNIALQLKYQDDEQAGW